MKVIFIEETDEVLQNIACKLGIKVVECENNIEDFIQEWRDDEEVIVLNTVEFKQAASKRVIHICKGLDILRDASEVIKNNFSQNQINDLTFSEVKYIQALGKNKEESIMEAADRLISESMCRCTSQDTIGERK
jgi:tyrosyl-tRNA synthetase